MKLIYSHLQQLLPSLDVAPQKLRDDLTMIGHFTNFYEEIDNEIVFDLDIKINRGDCLGYYGLARDLAVFYNIPLVLPDTSLRGSAKQSLPITVTSPDVTRVMCVKISNLKVSPSPDWLIKFLKLHNINSVNNIVDFSNYIMFLYSIPNHAFDATICGDNLIWENNNNKNTEFTTLDGTVLKLSPHNLVISNPQEVLSTDLVGGKKSGTYDNTTEIIIEVATYNRVRIRLDSRELKTVTEASIRLEKDLDPETIPLALNHLASLIVKQAGGQISSSIYDYYPQPISLPQISFDPTLPSRTAGISIPSEFSIDVLSRLGCILDDNLVTPPSIRPDITMEEDLVEEVVRFYGYNNIPTDQPITFKEVPDITPKEIYLIDQLKDKLIALGYDEVLTWPLVSKPVDPTTVINTQNSINTESIYLRQSLIPSLEQQLDQYQRFKVPNPKFFEIGKIFYKEGDKFIEKNSLGIYSSDDYKLMKDIDEILNINDSQKYLSDKSMTNKNFAEIILDDLPKPQSYSPKIINNSAIELTSQIITLDANVIIKEKINDIELINRYSSLIDKNILWSMEIIDVYQNRYTFRVSYYNCDDKTAKKIHLSSFNLTTDKYVYVDPKTPTVLEYYSNMYQTDLEATIINIKSVDDKKYVILDKTLFFPEGGGQPSDTGTINDIDVTKLQYKDEQVLHEIDNDKLSVGDKVKLKINWDKRYQYMKVHSAGHLLHEVLTEIYPSILPLKGYHQDEAYLIYKGQINPADTLKIESLFNQKVIENLPILCDYTDIETLSKDARSIPKNLPLHKKLRRLKIGNYPSMADGGIQVKSTKEIGKIKILSIDNTGDQVKINYQVL